MRIQSDGPDSLIRHVTWPTSQDPFGEPPLRLVGLPRDEPASQPDLCIFIVRM